MLSFSLSIFSPTFWVAVQIKALDLMKHEKPGGQCHSEESAFMADVPDTWNKGTDR